MAKRRMVSLDIVDTDKFLEMPTSTQCLYFHLLMRADDDGFVDSPKKIGKIVNCSDDDLKLLILKQFIIPFDSGVCVIKDWRIHNYIQSDRYKETLYLKEKSNLKLEDNNMYTLCIQNGDTGKVSIGKNSIDNNKETISFKKPTIEDIKNYCNERKNTINPNNFYDFYESKNWFVGRNKMKDWKACIRTWEQRQQKSNSNPSWFKQDIKKEETTKEEQEELKELMKRYN